MKANKLKGAFFALFKGVFQYLALLIDRIEGVG